MTKEIFDILTCKYLFIFGYLFLKYKSERGMSNIIIHKNQPVYSVMVNMNLISVCGDGDT